MEQQPFYVGQKVVCVKGFSNSRARLVEGGIYTVLHVVKCTNCEEWNVGFTTDPECVGIFRCCGSPQKVPFVLHASASRFAPLNPPRVSAIPELLKEPVEERVDHRQPIKILTTDG